MDQTGVTTDELTGNLTEHDKSLLASIDLSPDPMWIFDPPSRRFLAVNDAAIDLYGYSRDRFLKMSLDDIRPPEDVAALKLEISRPFTNKIHEAGKWRHITADGAVITVEVRTKEISFTGAKKRLVHAREVSARSDNCPRDIRERRLFAMAESVGQLGRWLYDIDKDELTWSAGLYEIFGIDPKTPLTFELFMSLVEPGDRDRLRALQGEMVEHGNPFEAEYRIITPKGQKRVIFERGGVERDASGRVIRRLGVAIDVTEDRAASNALRETTELLEIAEKTANFGGWRVDLNTRQVEWSNAVCEIHDMPHKTSVSADDGIAFYAPEYRRRIREVFEACAEQGVPFDEELAIISAKGVRKAVRSIGVPVKDSDGNIIAVQGAFQDITEKKEAENSIVKSNRRFRQLADAMPQIVWTATPDGVVDFINKTYIDYLGANPEDIAELNWTELVHPDDKAAGSAAWEHAVKHTESYETEFRIVSASGEYRWHRMSSRPIFDDDGKHVKWFGAGVDIHNRKVAEARLVEEGVKRQRLLDQMADGYIVLDDERRVIFANKQAKRFFNLTRKSFEGCKLQDLVTDLSGSELHKAIGKLTGNRHSIEFEYEERSSDAHYEARAFRIDDGIAIRFTDISAEREARQQIKLLETAVSRINDAIIVTECAPIDAPGPRIVFVNEAFTRMTGYDADEAIGNTPRMLQGPDTERDVLDDIRAALEANMPIRTEVLNYTKTGEKRYLELDIAPIFDADGNCQNFVAVQRDQTDARHTTQKLVESEARFRAAAQAAADAIWDWDIAAGMIWWSDGYRENFGHETPPEGSDTASWTSQVHPEDRERVLKSLEDAIRDKKERWDAEYRFLHLDGRVRIVKDRGYPIFNESGKAIRFVGGMTDISTSAEVAQKITKASTLAARHIEILQKLNRLSEADTTDIAGEIVRAAQAFLNGDGAALELLRGDVLVYDQVSGMASHNLGLEIGVDDSLSGLCLTTGEALLCRDASQDARVDVEAVRKAGLGSMVVAQIPGDAKPFGVLKVMARAPHAFDESDAAAVAMLGQSVGALLQRRDVERRLRQSQRLEAVGQLTGGIAHDFNNLLTIILGNAETFRTELAEDPNLRPLAELTQMAAERGAALTQRLLAFARQQPLAPTPTDLNNLLSVIDPMLRPTLGEHIEIELIRAAGLWPAMIDAAQLENAILNLALNARDAMAGGGRLTIETANVFVGDDYAAMEEELTPGRYVMLAISDTGTGMTADVLARAIEPFFTTKSGAKGSGLGLSMVYGFVKQSKGHIRIYSETGSGTTVKLYLPKALQSAVTGDVANPPSLVGGEEKILFVEDDDLVRAHVIGQLRSLGYKVVEARNGREALEAVRQLKDLDLVFTDVVMPGGMSGGELAKEIATLRPNLKVLFTSGYTENSIVHHGRLDEGVAFISKPFKLSDLGRKIREVLSKP